MNLSKLPTSPDGTDWYIYGDTPSEQWNGVILEALVENGERIGVPFLETYFGYKEIHVSH